jgi:hypothetical protein
MRRCFGRHHLHSGVMARLTADSRFLDAAVVAAGRHRSVFDAAVDLGLGRGTVPPGALARVVGAYLGGLA